MSENGTKKIRERAMNKLHGVPEAKFQVEPWLKTVT